MFLLKMCYVHTSGQLNTTHSDPFYMSLLSRLIGVQVDVLDALFYHGFGPERKVKASGCP